MAMASKIQKYLRYQKVQNVKICMLEIDKSIKIFNINI